jgi:adenylate cyclase
MPTRVGIHAGSALVGVVAGAGRYVSTIVGDVANTASRVEGLNKELGTRLLLSDEVLREVSDFVLRPLGQFLLARKSEPIRVAEVLGRTGDPVVAALATSFAMAFESFQSCCWNETVMLLQAVLRDHPNDGPSRYFLSRALRLRPAPEDAYAELVACVEKK